MSRRSQGESPAGRPQPAEASATSPTLATLLGPLFAQAPDAILVADQTGAYVEANPAACDLLGFEHAELVRLTVEDVVDHPEGWAMQEYARFLREGQWDGRVGLRTKDGQLVLARARAVVIPGPHGPLAVSFLSDLTDRAQSDVVRSRLAAIVQSSADAIVGETLDGIITDWNPAAQALYGYTAEEVIGRPLSLLHPEGDPAAIDALLAQVRAGVSIGPYETVRQTKDGRQIDVAITIFPVRDEAGRIVAGCGIVRDISARVASARALALSESRYRAVVESQSELICRFTPDTTLTFVNEAYCRSFDQPRDALLGTLFLDLIPEQGRAAVQRRVAAQVARPQRTAYEHEVVLPGGEIGWQAWVDTPILDDDGHLIEIQGIGRDITEQRRTEAALRQSEVRFRSLITNATDVITILDAEGVILYQSPSIQRILGYDPETLIGRNAFALVHDDDRERTWLTFQHTVGDPTLTPMVEFRFQHCDGSWRWLEATGTNLLADPNVAGFVVNSRDITERKQLEQHLRTALEAAQSGMRAKGQFLAFMSHELRTPLQAIQGYTELLLSAPDGSLTAEQRDDLFTISRSAGRMAALIGDLLEVSRLEAGRLQLSHEVLDLGEILEQVRQDVAPQAAAKRIRVDIQVPPHLPSLQGDAVRVRQILLNLVGNAVKFTDQGSIHITVSYDSVSVAITVVDTGMGIAPEVLPQIFDEFRLGESKLSRPGGGAGLGLAISRQLAELMGGTITVQSSPGEGSTFTVHLPLARRLRAP